MAAAARIATESTALKAPAARRIPSMLVGLDFTRLLGVYHITLFHFAFQLPISGQGWVYWGATWVVFFFVLSGFGVAHSFIGTRGTAASPDTLLPQPLTLLRRWVSVYPTYAVALLIAALALLLGHSSQQPRSAQQLVAEVFLFQAWTPRSLDPYGWYFMEETTSYNQPGWFISALVACWLGENLMIRLASLAARGPWWRPWVTFLVLLPAYAVLCPLASFYPLWGNRAAFPALAPVSFYIIDATVHLHHFFAGGLLAFVLHRRAEQGRPAVPYAASISLVAFVAICCTPALPDTGPYNRSSLFKQAGLHLPIFLGLVTGFAEGVDPLARFLDRFPRAGAGARNLALGIYILQRPLSHARDTTVLKWNGGSRDVLHFLAFLVALHALAAALQYGWPRSACLFSSLHVSPEGLRPWHLKQAHALFSEFLLWRAMLASLARARITPRMFTLVREEDVPRTWGYDTSAVIARVTHPPWASEWHRQSFAKLAVPRVARQLSCGVALFLDNDARAVCNLDDVFRVEPPAMAWHHEWHSARGSQAAPRLNSGVMLLPTDASFVEQLEDYTARMYANRTTPRHLREGSDQEVWQGFFAESGRRVNELPAAFNARKTMRLNTSAIVVAHLIKGDDDGDAALKAAHFIPLGVLDRPMPPS